MSEATYPARAAVPRRPRRPSAGPQPALWVAGVCVLALALTWALAELVPAARARDASVLRHFALLGGSGLHEAARVTIHLLDPIVFTLWALALVAIAVARGRPRTALAA